MNRRHWTHRQPRSGAKMALVTLLVPFLLVGCVSLEKARHWFGVAADVCDIVNKIKDRCSDVRKK
ncbi:hypothetical protein A6J71_10350 [Enterobacter cancerogenus]|uniref:hypothetical protein n=1 Tax=Enterobacter cancerogenus TaxID=69218 RepID=UPI000C9ABD2F|nr:hypothetical protein [Enterobacter cancerogenus]PNF10528.1 hypothetical protein A6J71_10350 [Enterobacter cancerogenus]